MVLNMFRRTTFSYLPCPHSRYPGVKQVSNPHVTPQVLKASQRRKLHQQSSKQKPPLSTSRVYVRGMCLSMHEILQPKGICMQSFHKPRGRSSWTMDFLYASISQVLSNNHLIKRYSRERKKETEVGQGNNLFKIKYRHS